jgi:hypothetical protein
MWGTTNDHDGESWGTTNDHDGESNPTPRFEIYPTGFGSIYLGQGGNIFQNEYEGLIFLVLHAIQLKASITQALYSIFCHEQFGKNRKEPKSFRYHFYRGSDH